MKHIKIMTLFLTGAWILSIGLTGCAMMDSGPRTDLLSSAGFIPKKPVTEKQRDAFDDLDNERMLTGVINGQRLYGYKDEDQGVLYVGDAKQYQNYQRLAAKEKELRKNVVAAEMDQETLKQYRVLVPYGYVH